MLQDSTLKEITVSAPRMGRPPIGKFTAIRLSAEMLARIDAIAGPGKRAHLIREMLDAGLTERENGHKNPA